LYDYIFDLDPEIMLALIDNSTNDIMSEKEIQTSDSFFYLERHEESPEDYHQWIFDFEPDYTTIDQTLRWANRKISR
jgi:hypothetical protein